MKGILKTIPPLAPDYSGVSSVFFTMGGAIIINGADGCIGNITGYDEPRYFDFSSHIFSSGLKETQAITGDEEILKRKIEDSLGLKEFPFIVLLGTPTSAVIASDHKYVSSIIMEENRIPVFAIDTTGINTYELGASKAFFELAKYVSKNSTRTNATKKEAVKSINIIGATPMDFWSNRQLEEIYNSLNSRGIKINSCWGMDNSFESILTSLDADINLVISYSGLKAAEYMKKHCNISYIIGVPIGTSYANLISDSIKSMKQLPILTQKYINKDNVLIIGDQVISNSIRDYYRLEGYVGEIRVVSLFKMNKILLKDGDVEIKSEDELSRFILKYSPDIVVGDPLFKAISDPSAKFIEVPHLAVSSRIHWDHDILYCGDNAKIIDYIY